MKALFLSHQSADHLGGAELSLVRIIEEWVQQDPSNTPIIVSPSPAGAIADAARSRGWSTRELDFEGWAVASTRGGRAERKLREFAAQRATRAIVDLIQGEDVRLVVTNTIVAPWAALAAALTGVPHIWFVREFAFAEQGLVFPGGREAALTDVGELSHAVVANSAALKTELVQWMNDRDIHVVYPPVDLERVRALSRQKPAEVTGFKAGRLSVTVVGRVTRSKGQWRVIEALGLLAREQRLIDVCFVGAVIDHRADLDLTARARKLGVRGSVVFAGEQSNPFPFINAADVCVVPTDIEAFGRVTLECLAIGRPVIATRQGAGAELVVPGSTGELFDANDVGELARALSVYADDPALSRAQSSAARARANALMSEEWGVSRALTIFESAVSAPSATLPAHWREWAVPVLASEMPQRSAPWHWHILARLQRTVSLAMLALRHPRLAVRRLAELVTR